MPRNRSSAVRDLLEILSLAPWWVGVLLAVASYAVLTALARQPVLEGSTVNLFAAWAAALRYIAPAVCLAGAIGSLLGRARRRRLLGAAQATDGKDAIGRMDWREFELLLGEAFRRRGYAVGERGSSGPDGGIDLVLRKDGKKALVQCKHWKAFSVPVETVRELYGVITAERADEGFVVTSGRFTAAARAFASGKPITLIDGAVLPELLRSPEQQVRIKRRA